MKARIGRYFKNNSRTISIKIDRFDTWSLDHTLAFIIYPLLVQLKESKLGVPNEFAEVGGEDYLDQYSFPFYAKSTNWAFNKKCKEWDEVLDKMIWSFEQIIKSDYSVKYQHGTPSYGFVDVSAANPATGKIEEWVQLVDNNPTEHWYDHQGLALHEERIQEGLTLFGRYYRNLWD